MGVSRPTLHWIATIFVSFAVIFYSLLTNFNICDNYVIISRTVTVVWDSLNNFLTYTNKIIKVFKYHF